MNEILIFFEKLLTIYFETVSNRVIRKMFTFSLKGTNLMPFLNELLLTSISRQKTENEREEKRTKNVLLSQQEKASLKEKGKDFFLFK